VGAMDDDGYVDDECGFRVQLELNLDCQPISGQLRPERGGVEPFVGWLGFVEALKRLYDAATTEREELPSLAGELSSRDRTDRTRERSGTMDDSTQMREADRIE
jgi:hypothetical protein